MFRFVFACISLFFYLPIVLACPSKKVFTIGVQAIDYAPHYNFIDENGRGYFNSVLKLLEQKTQCSFKVVSLPIKRLNLLFNQTDSMIDFIYPDNPNWHRNDQRFYSISLVTALGGTMVLESNKTITLSQVKTLVAPRGFTPVAWLKVQDKYNFIIQETSSAKSALKMVVNHRATAADVEYNVARSLAKKYKFEHLVVASNLPFTSTNFHLSTLKHPEFIKVINQTLQSSMDELSTLKQRHHIVETLSARQESKN